MPPRKKYKLHKKKPYRFVDSEDEEDDKRKKLKVRKVTVLCD